MKIKTTTCRGGSASRRARRARVHGPARLDLAHIRACIGELATAPSRLGLEALCQDDGPEVEAVLDPDALPVARAYLRALAGDPDATPQVAAIARRLAARLGQQHELAGICAALEQLDRDAADTDRELGRREQDMLATLDRVLGGLLDGTLGSLSPVERDQLRVEAAEVLELQAEQRAQREQERRLTIEAGREAETLRREAAQEAEMLRTQAALRAGRRVDEEALDRALATFERLRAARTGPPPAPL
ncbi:MAG: hypothetical protein RMK29_15060 [Myxococcales bacterium]|nr:hypothetical protein [Myxococcota bacterium]MDW8283034.1 hypothetical protein [Myxococcales bacterium]